LRHLGVGRPSVFDEMQGTTRTQHPVDLAQSTGNVGDGAHGPRDQNVVHAARVNGERLTVQAHVLNWYPACGNSLRRELAPNRCWIHRSNPVHSRRVMRNVQARAESDFEDFTR
jgi:hypothetical protein